MADCNPERIMCLWNVWIKLNYNPVLNVLLITDSQIDRLQIDITQHLYSKENHFEGSIVCFLG